MRSDARKNYDRLLAVGREVVTEQGAEASLRDVARRAGVGLGTLYRHFPTREALLEALLRTNVDDSAAIADDLRTLADRLDALEGSLATPAGAGLGGPTMALTTALTSARIVLLGLLLWLAVPAIASTWLGWRLRRRIEP